MEISISHSIPLSHEEIQIKILKNPVFVYAGRLCFDREWHTPKHSHKDITEIFYIMSGESRYIIGDREYSAKAGDIVLCSGGITHEEYHALSGSFEGYFCGINNIQVQGLRELWLTPENISPVLTAGESNERIKALFHDLYEESCSRQAGYEHVCGHLAACLCVMILRLVNESISVCGTVSSTGKTHALVNKMIEYMNSNLAGISINKIAGEFHLNPSYISHLFKRVTGVTPIKYCTAKRVDDAKRLLVSTEMTVGEIAAMLGYENVNHFYLPFKKYTGVTPKEYRRNIRNGIFSD